MGELVYKCKTHASAVERDVLRAFIEFSLSLRDTLTIYTDRLECRDWIVAYEDMDESVLMYTTFLFMPSYWLRVKAHGRIYQFCLKPSKFWTEGVLPFPFTRERLVLLCFPWLSTAIRWVVAAAFAYGLWKTFSDP
ncbi:MAG: hypothetical protein ACKVX7_10740 [Planctomycetota bacterium]